MPIYKGSEKMEDIYFGNKPIAEVYYGSELKYRKAYVLPATSIVPMPTDYNEILVARVSGANYQIYEVPETGWYEVTVSGASGSITYKNEGWTTPGLITKHKVIMYKGTKCLLWAGKGGHGYKAANTAYSGFPGVQNNYWGGTGAVGSGESGGGGGGPAQMGGAAQWKGGGGGAGAGFLAGIDKSVTSVSFMDSKWSRPFVSTDAYTAGAFDVRHLYIALLCGGAGGNSSDNGGNRSGGGGGGAYGGGGYAYAAGTPENGPGGDWGRGATGGHYASGATGAWSILDTSTNTLQWGYGTVGRPSSTDGFCELYYLKPTQELAVNQVIFESGTPGTYELNIPNDSIVEMTMVGAGGENYANGIKIQNNSRLSIGKYLSGGNNYKGGGAGALLHGRWRISAGTYKIVIPAVGSNISCQFGDIIVGSATSATKDAISIGGKVINAVGSFNIVALYRNFDGDNGSPRCTNIDEAVGASVQGIGYGHGKFGDGNGGTGGYVKATIISKFV